MSELNNLMDSLPQVLINARVKEELKYTYLEDSEIKEEVEKKLKNIFMAREE